MKICFFLEIGPHPKIFNVKFFRGEYLRNRYALTIQNMYNSDSEYATWTSQSGRDFDRSSNLAQILPVAGLSPGWGSAETFVKEPSGIRRNSSIRDHSVSEFGMKFLFGGG